MLGSKIVETNEIKDEANNLDNLQKSTVVTSIISSLITVTIIVLILLFSFQPIQQMNENSSNITATQKDILAIKESIEISRKELEVQVTDYISQNYGELSERDEKVDKLLIYFRRQDSRLSNIEKALSKF